MINDGRLPQSTANCIWRTSSHKEGRSTTYVGRAILWIHKPSYFKYDVLIWALVLFGYHLLVMDISMTLSDPLNSYLFLQNDIYAFFNS